MDNMEFNKIFAAILVAGIIAMLSGFIADKLYHPKDLKENAVKIEGIESGGAQIAKKKTTADPAIHLIAEADVARGQKIAKACAACHNFEKGGPNGVGPNLWGIVDRHKAGATGFAYSDVLKEHSSEKWSYASLNQFLWKPKAYAPGTKMNFIGLKKPEDRAAVIAWLREQSASPAALPSAADIAAEEEKYGVEEEPEMPAAETAPAAHH